MVTKAVVRRAILVVAALLSASPARALIQFEGSGGWNLGLEGQNGCLQQTFSNYATSATCGGVTPVPCDGSGTNYICWDDFGQTELVGGARLKPIFEALEQKFGYDEIRLVVAHLNRARDSSTT